MPRHTYARIDEQAVLHNIVWCEMAGDARAMAVVKADGPAGIERVAWALADEAPCCSGLHEEAEALRGAGLTHPIVLRGCAQRRRHQAVCPGRFFSVLHSDYQIDWLLGRVIDSCVLDQGEHRHEPARVPSGGIAGCYGTTGINICGR